MTNLFNSLTLTQKQLLTLVKGGLWGKATGTDLFENALQEEWEEVAELAAIQGVLGIAYDGMKELPQSLHPPKNIIIKWALGVEAIEKRHQYQIKALQSLATLFKENNIRCLLLKGPGIGQLYPIPEYRESGDLDIYLFGDYEKGNRLVEERGIKVEYADKVHSKFLFNGVTFENHLSFLENSRSKRYHEYEEVLHEELIRLSPEHDKELNVFLPSLTFNLYFLLQHTVKHFLAQGAALRQMCDWALLLRHCRDSNEFEHFYTVSIKFGLRRYADAFNAISIDYLGLPDGEQFNIDRDTAFMQRVFLDILDQERLNISVVNESSGNFLFHKLKYSRLFFKNKWKFEAISRKMFFQELMIRLRNTSKAFLKARK